MQRAIVLDLERKLSQGANFAFAAGLEGVPLTPKKRGEMRQQGMQAGEPDLRFYFDGGRTLLIELKADGGSLNAAQKTRHARLRALGFDVRVVKAKTEEDAVAQVSAIIEEELAK